MSPETLTRPVLRYLGGKWRLAPRILERFPPHRVYLEPYGGAASVLLQKPRSYSEIYNDLDGEVVSLFRVLRDPDQAARLIALLELTPFARDEFVGAYEASDCPVETARRLVARSFMGHGSTASARLRRTGFRADSRRSNTTASHDWARLPASLEAVVRRLQGVIIENRPALSLITRFAAPDCLIYADPPYMHATRSPKVNRNGGGGERSAIVLRARDV